MEEKQDDGKRVSKRCMFTYCICFVVLAAVAVGLALNFTSDDPIEPNEIIDDIEKKITNQEDERETAAPTLRGTPQPTILTVPTATPTNSTQPSESPSAAPNLDSLAPTVTPFRVNLFVDYIFILKGAVFSGAGFNQFTDALVQGMDAVLSEFSGERQSLLNSTASFARPSEVEIDRSDLACVDIPDIDVTEDRCAFVKSSIILQYFDEGDSFLSDLGPAMNETLFESLFSAVQASSPPGSRTELYLIDVDTSNLDGGSFGGETAPPTAGSTDESTSSESPVPSPTPAPGRPSGGSGFIIPGAGGPTGTNEPTVFSTDLASDEFTSTEFPVPSPTPAPGRPSGGSGFIIPGAGGPTGTSEPTVFSTDLLSEEFTTTETPVSSPTPAPGGNPSGGSGFIIPGFGGPTGTSPPTVFSTDFVSEEFTSSPTASPGGGSSGFTVPLESHENIFDHKRRRYLRSRHLN